MRGFAPEQRRRKGGSCLSTSTYFSRGRIFPPNRSSLCLQDFRTLLEERGGSVGKTEYWGLKSLAFRIKKNRKAHYALMNIDAPHEAVTELERQMRLSTDIIRFLTVRVDEHDAAPSPMMRRADRDEREGRGDRDRDRDRGDRRGGRRDRDFAPREARGASDVEVEEVSEGEET